PHRLENKFGRRRSGTLQLCTVIHAMFQAGGTRFVVSQTSVGEIEWPCARCCLIWRPSGNKGNSFVTENSSSLTADSSMLGDTTGRKKANLNRKENFMKAIRTLITHAL